MNFITFVVVQQSSQFNFIAFRSQTPISSHSLIILFWGHFSQGTGSSLTPTRFQGNLWTPWKSLRNDLCVCSFLKSRPTAFMRFPKGQCSPLLHYTVKKQYQPRDLLQEAGGSPFHFSPFGFKEAGWQLPTALRKGIRGQDELSYTRNSSFIFIFIEG